jgi:SAM-dependent methyltransferase
MAAWTPRPTADGRYLLNIGCGSRFHAEWNNLDLHAAHPAVSSYDLLTGLPYRDDTFDAVYSAHFFEHLAPGVAHDLVRECYRVTKPGGVVRFVLPDLEYSARLYLECLEKVRISRDPVDVEHYEWAQVNLIDQLTRDKPGGRMAEFFARPRLLDADFVRSTAAGPDLDIARASPQRPRAASGVVRTLRRRLRRMLDAATPGWYRSLGFLRSGETHKWMYDAYSLSRMMRDVGFGDVAFMDADKSNVPGFAAYHLDVDGQGNVQKPHSLYAEAVKPRGPATTA